MDITINVSDKAEQNIREKAEESGKRIETVVEEFVENNFANGDRETGKREHNLLAFAGMFSSGKTDISERMHEILYSEDFDPAEGFSIK